jgi:nitroreductase
MSLDTGTPTLLRSAVAAAVRAPSMHNTQPWRFRLTTPDAASAVGSASAGSSLEVRVDRRRQLVVADPAGWGVRIACGAAVFNARLAFAVGGHPAVTQLRPDPGEPDLIARLTPGPPHPPTPRESALFAAIPLRHSNRRPFTPEPVPAEVRRELVAAAVAEEAWLDLLIGRGPLAAVAEVVRAADTALVRDAGYRRELTVWSRRADSDDGVPLAAGGPSPEPQDLLALRDFGGGTRSPGREYETDPLVAVLGTAGDTVLDQIVAGQALQRVLLTATDHQLAVSLLSQPIEVPAARDQLRHALGRRGTPQMVLRIGYGQPGFPTRRRPVEDVIDDGA